MTKVFDLGERLMENQTAKEILEWSSMAPGMFSVYDIDRDFGFTTTEQRRDRTAACEALVSDGELERVGDRRGHYRPRQNQLERQDLRKKESNPVNLWLPFGITSGQKPLVNIYSGNIVTIAGEKNSGKTGFLLNTAKGNRDKWYVHYFNSEMPTDELIVRLKLFGLPIEHWENINFYRRHKDFSDVIFGGKRDLNIIDFLEISDDFYKMGGIIRDIYDKTKDAVTIIAMQKKTGADNPRGGEFSKEKTRLHIDLVNCDGEYRHKALINPAKNWAQSGINPTGLYTMYKLVQGHDFRMRYNQDGGIWFRKRAATNTKEG